MTIDWGGVRKLEAGDNTRRFKCGRYQIDNYFKNHAFTNASTGMASCFVLPRPDGHDELPLICGMYTLSMDSVKSVLVQPLTGMSLPPYNAPVALIGQFGVDKSTQGKGAGNALLIDAIQRAIAGDVACTGVVTDALDDVAMGFYVKRSFAQLDPDETKFPRRLFLPLGTIRQLGPPSRRSTPGPELAPVVPNLA